MRTHLLLIALLTLLPRPGAAAEVERARHSSCTGIYTGSARGVFWCKVTAVFDARTGRSTFRVETDDDIQLTGDALQVVPGGFEWKGPPAVGVLKSTDEAVASAWSTLQTSQPPNQVDYAAGRGAGKRAPDLGQLTLDLSAAAPGPKAGDAQTYTVHGSFHAHMLPIPGSKGMGEVRVTVTF